MTVSPNRRPRSQSLRGISQRAGKNSLLRRLLMESLEKRELMASDFTNPFYPMDVNRDSRISALDALVVINRLNRDGAIPLEGL
jgi:Dockerin type I domain